MDLKKSQNDIVKVAFWINLIALIIGLFYPTIWIPAMVIGINVTLMGTHWIITKNFVMFQGLLAVNSVAKNLNKKLGEFHGQVLQ